VLFHFLEPKRTEVRFDTLSGILTVRAAGDRLVMDFPRWSLEPADDVPPELATGLGAKPSQVLSTNGNEYFFCVFDNEAQVEKLNPDLRVLEVLKACYIVTAPGTQSDCVCRFFAPAHGIDEDAGTGSIRCAL